MCLLVLYFRRFPEAPLVVGANREEAYARGGEPPQLLPGRLRAMGGRDPRAGGTWLGVNEAGMVVAVTNRPKSWISPAPRSRGLLARDLLDCQDAVQASREAMEALSSNRYAGCNYLCADARDAFIIQGGDQIEIRELKPGLHLLSAGDLNDPADQRLRLIRAWLEERDPVQLDSCLETLRRCCGAGPDSPDGACVRHETGGTVSSSIIALRDGGGIYLHAPGPPDVHPFQSNTDLLNRVLGIEN